MLSMPVPDGEAPVSVSRTVPIYSFLMPKMDLKRYFQASSLSTTTTGCDDLIFLTYLPNTLQGLEIIF